MASFDDAKKTISETPKTWLITGVAGFIGSNLLEELLRLDQRVVGLDNFSTGFKRNLESVQKEVKPEQWARFRFIEGDIRDLKTCRDACKDAERVLHQAALGSVPRSIEDPVATNEVNIGGFLNMLVAARDARATRFVYAASSSTYGDHPALPKREEVIGTPLSPYALTKLVNEQYARLFAKTYDYHSIGLRYFNVFGRRQDPNGAYAAVIPKWIVAMIEKEQIWINGDGTTSRDFCYVDNAVQMNLLAAVTEKPEALDQVYNVAAARQTSLNELFETIRANLADAHPHLKGLKPDIRAFRAGDVRHSLADIGKAQRLLGYVPTHDVCEGLAEAVAWYEAHFSKR